MKTLNTHRQRFAVFKSSAIFIVPKANTGTSYIVHILFFILILSIHDMSMFYVQKYPGLIVKSCDSMKIVVFCEVTAVFIRVNGTSVLLHCRDRHCLYVVPSRTSSKAFLSSVGASQNLYSHYLPKRSEDLLNYVIVKNKSIYYLPNHSFFSLVDNGPLDKWFCISCTTPKCEVIDSIPKSQSTQYQCNEQSHITQLLYTFTIKTTQPQLSMYLM